MFTKTLVVMGFIVLMVNQANAGSISLGPQIGYYKSRTPITDRSWAGRPFG